MTKEKEIRGWRLFRTAGQPGVHVWFDPTTELLTLRDLTMVEKLATLDKLGSVSVLRLAGDAEVIDGCEQGSRGSLESPSFVQLDFLKESD